MHPIIVGELDGSTPSRGFDVAELRYWGVARTISQLTAAMSSALNVSEFSKAELRGYWRFDDSSQLQKDSSLWARVRGPIAFPSVMSSPPSPPPHYVGCYNTVSRASLGWEQKSGQSLDSSLATLQALCAGWQYLSIECPGSHGIHVFCANNLGSGNQLNDTECTGNEVVTIGSANCDANTDGCTGPYSFGGGLPAGACHRGAVYLV